MDYSTLSRRERQIMDVLCERGEASAQEVRSGISDPPSYSAIRALIARLVEKGHVRYRLDGNRHVYSAVVEEKKLRRSALGRLVKTFFRGSSMDAVSALIDNVGEELSQRELKELERKITNLKKLSGRHDG